MDVVLNLPNTVINLVKNALRSRRSGQMAGFVGGACVR